MPESKPEPKVEAKPEIKPELKADMLIPEPPENHGRECRKPECVCHLRRKGIKLPPIGAKTVDGKVPRPTWESQRAYFGR